MSKIFAIHAQLDLAEPVSARTARFTQWYGRWCDDFSFKGSLVTKSIMSQCKYSIKETITYPTQENSKCAQSAVVHFPQ